MKPSLKVLAVFFMIGLMALVTAAPAFAGRPEGPADKGLMNAAERVNANAASRGANPSWGTHHAACHAIMYRNGAISHEIRMALFWSCVANPPQKIKGPK